MEIYNKIKKDLGWLCCFVLIIQFLWNFIIPVNYDSTDDGKTRSGMSLRIDHETGLQYLEGSRGGLTPRLNSKGEHMKESK